MMSKVVLDRNKKKSPFPSFLFVFLTLGVDIDAQRTKYVHHSLLSYNFLSDSSIFINNSQRSSYT